MTNILIIISIIVLEVTDLEEEKEVTANWSVSDNKDSRHFVTMLTEAFWVLHSTKPSNSMLAPVCLPGNFFELLHIIIFRKPF